MELFWLLILYFCLLNFNAPFLDEILQMLGFALWISGVGSVRSTNRVTTIAPSQHVLHQWLKSWYKEIKRLLLGGILTRNKSQQYLTWLDLSSAVKTLRLRLDSNLTGKTWARLGLRKLRLVPALAVVVNIADPITNQP